MNHFTHKAGYNAIGSQVVWTFRAGTPPGDHPCGAYFTTLGANSKNLAVRLRIPKVKLAFVFEFEDKGDLKALDGDRGEFIFFSKSDYPVDKPRQVRKGRSGL